MNEQLPWLCPTCAQFSTRPADETNPTHECRRVQRTVALIAYENSTQAEHLRRTLDV